MIVFLTNDLVFPSRVMASARRHQVSISCGSNLTTLLPTDQSKLVHMLWIDLTLPKLDLTATLALMRAHYPSVPVLAYGPHVQTDRLQEAKQAGCQVLTRGQFDRDFDSILQSFASPRSQDHPQSPN